MNGKIATNANEFIELQLDERLRQIKEVFRSEAFALYGALGTITKKSTLLSPITPSLRAPF